MIFFKYTQIAVSLSGVPVYSLTYTPKAYVKNFEVKVSFTNLPAICACGIDRRDCEYHRGQ